MTDYTTITDPADWREGDHVTLDADLRADALGDLYLCVAPTYSPWVRIGSTPTTLGRAVAVSRLTSPLPTKPGTVFRARLEGHAGERTFEVGAISSIGSLYYTPGYVSAWSANDIVASTVRILDEPK